MKRLQALQAKLAALRAEAETILANGEVAASQQERLDAIESELMATSAAIEQEQRVRALLRSADPVPLDVATGARIEVGADRAAQKPWGFDSFGTSLDAFVASQPTYNLAPDHRAHPQERYLVASSGEFLLAVRNARMGLGIDPRLQFEAAATGAGEGVGADGGFLVPRSMADRILIRMTGGDVLSRVTNLPMTDGNSIDINVINETSRATGSRFGAVRGYRIGEGDSITASRPKFAALNWKLRKYAALGYASDELLADASLIGRVIFDAFGEELRFLAEDDVIEGTGSGMPQGILVAASTVSVSKETGQAAATFVYENAVKMRSRLHARNRRNAVWFINQDVEPQLALMNLAVGVGGAPVLLPPGGGSPYQSLLGHPIIPIEYCSTLGTVGDVILADLGEYWWFDKGSPQQAVSMHVAFVTDEQAFRVIYRADGRSSWPGALTPFKGTATQSFAVTLATRA